MLLHDRDDEERTYAYGHGHREQILSYSNDVHRCEKQGGVVRLIDGDCLGYDSWLVEGHGGDLCGDLSGAES